MLTGYPISARLPQELGIGERFWYWRGASGRSYIHSIYPAGNCPPLPGAVFLAVGRDASGNRQVLAVGRFSSVWDESESLFSAPVSEIHVHLLACGAANAELVMADLREALMAGTAAGSFAETGQPAYVSREFA